MRKRQDTEKSKKFRLIRIVTVELIIMAVSVCVSIMPMPYRLIVPIIIGARSILLKAHQYAKAPPAPETVHCCGAAEPKSKKQNRKVQAKSKDSESKEVKNVKKST